jgi:hypothetical protein
VPDDILVPIGDVLDHDVRIRMDVDGPVFIAATEQNNGHKADRK